MSSKPRSEMNDLSHFCYRCGALHISRRRPCGFFIFLYYLRKPRSMPNPFTSPRSGGHLVLSTTFQYFPPLFSTFHQLSFYFFTSTGCRQIYRVPADLPGAGRSTGCRQIYRVPADLPGTGRSTGCRQIYRVLQIPDASLCRFSTAPVSP